MASPFANLPFADAEFHHPVDTAVSALGVLLRAFAVAVFCLYHAFKRHLPRHDGVDKIKQKRCFLHDTSLASIVPTAKAAVKPQAVKQVLARAATAYPAITVKGGAGKAKDQHVDNHRMADFLPVTCLCPIDVHTDQTGVAVGRIAAVGARYPRPV